MNTTNKVALVTGSSSGIGLAAAVMLKEAGFMVYASARRKESLENLQEQGFLTVALDVTDEASMAEAVQHIEAEHGGVAVLVNNAGYGQSGPLEVLPLEHIRQQFEINVFGLIRMCQLVLPSMRRAGWGRIINVGSIGGTFSVPGAGAYHASKFALEAFSDSLRAEVQDFGVGVVLVQPTGVYTNFAEKFPSTYPAVAPDSPYHFFIQKHIEVATAIFRGPTGVVSAEKVAKSILHAAKAKSPLTRYKVGIGAYALYYLRRLVSDRAWDRMMQRKFPMREKKSKRR